MKLIFYLFIFSQFLNLIAVFAEKPIKEITELNSIKWEKIKENNSNNLKKIIWKSYNDDESYFKNKENNLNNNVENAQKLLQIESHLPLNNYLEDSDLNFSTNWKSAFNGGAGGGTGHQNISIRFDYGLSDYSLLSIYASETDDPLYNLINGELIPNNWASLAIAYKKSIFESENSKNLLSFATSLEYWVVSSGSSNKKSIYNEIDNSKGLDRYESYIYSFSFPFTRELNKKTKLSIVPGATFIPDTLGDKNVGTNFYGNNYFLGTGLIFDIATDLQLIGSYTFLLGPGNNSFDENLIFSRNSIYSYGFNWDVNKIIGFEGKITNGYGSTPSTSLLTIPSDNKPLYYLGASYKPFFEDTKFIPLDKNNKLLLLGGLTVENALFPERGISQISFNYDETGNLYAFYGYSLSNIFQIELRTGSLNDVNLANNENSNFQGTYLNENTFNYRFGGKLSIFSPQKGDPFWTTLRTSLGRNAGANRQGYVFSELINTFRINNWLAFNVSPKYFFSGLESFGGIGISSYINLLDNLQFIPEINTSFENSDFNSSFALRYSYAEGKSVDLYYSNAVGINDIGQLFEDKEYKFGLKFNFLY